MTNKKFKGIIFDFNGTLFWDSPKHKKAWQLFLKETYGMDISDEFYFEKLHGSTNPLIYESIFGKKIPIEIQKSFGKEKEEYYRRLCIEEKEKNGEIKLGIGAEDLLDFLQKYNIPHAIATSSEISNVNFYKELFNLDKWFKNRIIYDDGSVRGKPFPDLYLKAGKILNLPMEDIIIVEDACAGVKAAKNAGAGLVVGIAPYGEEMFVGKEYTDILIKDFTVFDRNLFEC